MGRKIPAKRHRGVKDPLLQQAKRLENLKGKINAPPKDPDEQPIPRSLIRLFGLPDTNKKDTVKKKPFRKARQSERKDESVRTGDNPISRLRKLPGESGRGFSLRINSAIKALHGSEEDLEYPNDLEAEDYKGQQMAEQRERRAKKRRRAEKAARKSGGGGGEEGGHTEERLTRTQKFALRKKAKKMKALEGGEGGGGELRYERVAFGEVCAAPPALLRAPAGAGAGAAGRPGRRNLLLTSMLTGAAGASPPGASPPGRADDERRLRAVAAYRALRAAKYKHK